MMTDDSNASDINTETPSAVPTKKRGVVGQMVREIEKGVRKLTGKRAKVSKLKTSSDMKSPEQNSSNLLKSNSEVVKVFSNENQSTLVASGPDRLTSVKDITALVTPAPYRTPDSIRGTTSGLARFKLRVSVPRVRRTQSERAMVKPHTFKNSGYFRSLQTTQSNLSKSRLPIPVSSATELDSCASNRDRSSSASKLCVSPSVNFRRVASSPQLSAITSQQSFMTSTNTADHVRS